MESGPEDRLALIRRYYEAYDNSDRSLMESGLHAQFTFSSPNDDDNIDQALYFAGAGQIMRGSDTSSFWTSAPIVTTH